MPTIHGNKHKTRHPVLLVTVLELFLLPENILVIDRYDEVIFIKCSIFMIDG